MSNEERVTYFAQTDSRNKRVSFGIKSKDRSRHMYVIGKTGMGKSTLLENMAIQDIRNGEGMSFIDPHGKSADLLLDYVPEDRIKDVLYFAPFDMDRPIGFNVMEDVDPDRRHLVVNGLMSTFEKIWEDAWSARMSYILQNTIHALLEYPDATLLDVNRMYTNKAFRNKVVDNVEDPSVKSFWVDEYAKYTDRYTQEATPAIQNKIGQLAANPVIRNILGQPKSSFDIREMMDHRKILIVNLSKGKMGEMNANLLGSMIINKIYLAAMSRADVPEHELVKLPNFYTFVDEFQSFANRSFADILSESRKYKLNLTMAHQYIEQMSEEVRAAVFGNVGTLATFRVGAYDAEILEKEFSPTFIAEDIVNLGFAQIYLKLMIDGVSSPPFSAQTLPPMKQVERSHRDEIIESSRSQFSESREKVEEAIRERGIQTTGEHRESAETDNSKKGSSNRRAKDVGSDDNKGGQNDRKQKREQKKAPDEGSTDLRSVLSSITSQMKSSDQSHTTKEKKEQDDGKGVTEESSSQLRDVLKKQGVLDDVSSSKKKTKPKKASSGSRSAESRKPQKEQSAANEAKNEQSQKPNEIPEDVLNEMLHVDDDGK